MKRPAVLVKGDPETIAYMQYIRGKKGKPKSKKVTKPKKVKAPKAKKVGGRVKKPDSRLKELQKLHRQILAM